MTNWSWVAAIYIQVLLGAVNYLYISYIISGKKEFPMQDTYCIHERRVQEENNVDQHETFACV